MEKAEEFAAQFEYVRARHRVEYGNSQPGLYMVHMECGQRPDIFGFQDAVLASVTLRVGADGTYDDREVLGDVAGFIEKLRGHGTLGLQVTEADCEHAQALVWLGSFAGVKKLDGVTAESPGLSLISYHRRNGNMYMLHEKDGCPALVPIAMGTDPEVNEPDDVLPTMLKRISDAIQADVEKAMTDLKAVGENHMVQLEGAPSYVERLRNVGAASHAQGVFAKMVKEGGSLDQIAPELVRAAVAGSGLNLPDGANVVIARALLGEAKASVALDGETYAVDGPVIVGAPLGASGPVVGGEGAIVTSVPDTGGEPSKS